MALAASVYPPLDQRPFKNTVLLFDVDDTLTKPRQVCWFSLCSLMIDEFPSASIMVPVKSPLKSVSAREARNAPDPL